MREKQMSLSTMFLGPETPPQNYIMNYLKET